MTLTDGGAEYEMDSEDERFLKRLNTQWKGQLSEDQFEEMIDIFEIEAFKTKGHIQMYSVPKLLSGVDEDVCFVCNDVGCDESNMIMGKIHSFLRLFLHFSFIFAFPSSNFVFPFQFFF